MAGAGLTRVREKTRTGRGPLRFCRLLGRLLISLSLLVLLVSPLTESIADFDSFPRGQDFELSMFVVLALLCLVLLAALWARRLVEEAFGDRIWEPHEFWETPLSLLSYLVGGSEVWIPPKPALSLGVFALPLRI